MEAQVKTGMLHAPSTHTFQPLTIVFTLCFLTYKVFNIYDIFFITSQLAIEFPRLRSLGSHVLDIKAVGENVTNI